MSLTIPPFSYTSWLNVSRPFTDSKKYNTFVLIWPHKIYLDYIHHLMNTLFHGAPGSVVDKTHVTPVRRTDFHLPSECETTSRWKHFPKKAATQYHEGYTGRKV